MREQNDKISPCPFCGGEADFLGSTITIKCKSCGGAFIATNPLRSRYEIAQAWNTRKGVGQVAEEQNNDLGE